MSKTFKTRFATAFRTWAESRDLSVVIPTELCKAGQCAAYFHENGLVTVKLWEQGAEAAEEITLPGTHVLALIGGAK